MCSVSPRDIVIVGDWPSRLPLLQNSHLLTYHPIQQLELIDNYHKLGSPFSCFVFILTQSPGGSLTELAILLGARYLVYCPSQTAQTERSAVAHHGARLGQTVLSRGVGWLQVAACRHSNRRYLPNACRSSSSPHPPIHRDHFIVDLFIARPSLAFDAIMAFKIPRALVIALSLSSVAAAYKNYTSVDMMRAQLALMEDRPKDCPPWYAFDDDFPQTTSAWILMAHLVSQLQLQPPRLLLRSIRAL